MSTPSTARTSSSLSTVPGFSIMIVTTTSRNACTLLLDSAITHVGETARGYGFCIGQITTLSPIIVRREFGGASFGTVYGVAGTVIQLSSAFGPALYGVARDLLGTYPPVLAIAAGFELAAWRGPCRGCR